MKFSKITLALVSIFLSFGLLDHDGSKTIDEVDTYVQSMMAHHEVPGLGLAVIKSGKIIHEGYYGKASMTTGELASEKSLWRIYSLTKLTVATAIFQLLDQDKLSLDDQLSDYFNDLPDEWRKVEIRHLLAHASGLPDIIKYEEGLNDDSLDSRSFLKLLYDDEMDFHAGSQWSYNQTNYLLLKEIIELVSGEKMENFILNNQFASAQEEVVFSCDTYEEISHRVDCYSFDKENEEYVTKPEHEGAKGHPLSGLNLSLDAFINWDQELSNNTFLSRKALKKMWLPFQYSDSNRKFLSGWDVYESNDIESYGFSGGGLCAYRKFIHNDLSIILFSNGFKHYSIHNVMIDRIAGMLDPALENKNDILIEDLMAEYFISDEIDDLDETLNQIIVDNSNTDLEEVLKSIGFKLFFELDRKDEAITIFKRNVLQYPDAYDAHGSLGYLYLLTKQYELARKFYQKAEDLNPDNSYSKRRLKEINEILSK